MSDTAQAGCLLVLNSSGHVVETIAGGPIDGPWDMTAVTRGPITTLFVSNVLNNIGATAAPNGTVVRLRLFSFPGHAPRLFDADVIGTGFPTRTDPGALVIGADRCGASVSTTPSTWPTRSATGSPRSPMRWTAEHRFPTAGSPSHRAAHSTVHWA